MKQPEHSSKGPSMTGAELRAYRCAAGLSQEELARQAGFTRDTVRYWEAKTQVNLSQAAPRAFVEVLGFGGFQDVYTRARGWGLTQAHTRETRMAERLAAAQVRTEAREAERAAQTRKAQPCRLLSEPGQRRCKFHGGRSTGPRTPEGRARIAEAQHRRWAAWRAGKVAETSG